MSALPQREAAAVPWLTALELAAQTAEEVDWIAEGYAARGSITLLVAAIKAGKSTLVGHLVHSVLRGRPFLGQHTVAGPVLWITEEGRISMRRLLGRCRLLDRPDLHVLHARDVTMEWPALVAAARGKAREVGAVLLVVDTVGRLAGLSGDSENAAGAAAAAMRPLEAAAGDGLAVVAPQHARKGGGEPDEAGRGSSAIGGAADIIVQLARCGAAQPRTVREIRSVSRYEETPDQVLVELDVERHEYKVLGETAHIAQDRARTAVLQVLHDRAEHRESELTSLQGISRTTVQRVLAELETSGRAERLGKPRSKIDPTRWRLASDHLAHGYGGVGKTDAEGENGAWPRPSPHVVLPTPSPVGAGKMFGQDAGKWDDASGDMLSLAEHFPAALAESEAAW